jgi:hypothetical protein
MFTQNKNLTFDIEPLNARFLLLLPEHPSTKMPTAE